MTRPCYVVRAADEPPAVLLPAGTLHIGRHASNDLVLEDEGVSRFHARLVWPEGAARPLVEDLRSENGTFVGSSPIRSPTPLGELAVVAVGGALLRIELTHPALIPDDGRLECRLHVDARTAEEAGEVEGAAELRDLLLALERGRRTGTLRLERGDTSAELTLAAGRIVDAVATIRVEGAAALREALQLAAGCRFVLRPEIEPHECSLDVLPGALFTPRAHPADLSRAASRAPAAGARPAGAGTDLRARGRP